MSKWEKFCKLEEIAKFIWLTFVSWVDCDGSGGIFGDIIAGLITENSLPGMLKLKMFLVFGSGEQGDFGGCGGLV